MTDKIVRIGKGLVVTPETYLILKSDHGSMTQKLLIDPLEV